MKHVLVLFTQESIDTGAAEPAALCAALNAAAGAAAQYDFATYQELVHVVSPRQADITWDGRSLSTYDAVYQRRWGEAPDQAMAVNIFLRQHGVPCLDDETDRRGSMSKLTQYWRMWQHTLPFPKTVFVSSAHLQEWLRSHLQETFSLPCILKSANGTRGSDNYLVHSVDEALEIAVANPDVPFLVQEFIPNDGDYRVLVCGNEAALTIHRVSSGQTHTNNTSQGGTATLLDDTKLPAEIQALCVRAAHVFGRNIAGVDVVCDKHTGDYYLFEVNRAPQVEHSSYTAEKAEALHSYFMRLQKGEHDER